MTRYLKLLIVIIIEILPFYSFGQTRVSGHLNNKRAGNSDITAKVAGFQKHAAGKTTTAVPKLLAYIYSAYSAGSYSLVDSAVYTYSGTRSGYTNSYGWQWQYDTSISYHNNGVTFINEYKESQEFDVNNNVTRYTEWQWDTPTSTWIKEYVAEHIYDAMNHLTHTDAQTVNGSGWDSMRYSDTYDPSGNLLTELGEYRGLASLSWQNNSRYTYAYDGSNNLLTSVQEIWNTATTAWDSSYKTISTYDMANNELTELGLSWNGVSWTNDYKYLNSNFVAHQPGIQIIQTWTGGTFVNVNKDSVIYNSYNEPVYEYRCDWAGSAWVFNDGDYRIHNHYDTLVTDVAVLNKGIADISVYPVPASTELSVDITWSKPQMFAVILTDMQGRVYMRINVEACMRYTKKISMADLSAGNYIISIESASGKTTRKISVIK